MKSLAKDHISIIGIATLAAWSIFISSPAAHAAQNPCTFQGLTGDVQYSVCVGFGNKNGSTATEVSGSYSGIPARPTLTLTVNGNPGPSRKPATNFTTWDTPFGAYPAGTRVQVCLSQVPFETHMCSPTLTVPQ